MLYVIFGQMNAFGIILCHNQKEEEALEHGERGEEGWVGSLLMRERYRRGEGGSTEDKSSLLFVLESICTGLTYHIFKPAEQTQNQRPHERTTCTNRGPVRMGQHVQLIDGRY